MQLNYFERLAQDTPTRLWINNPNLDAITKALEAGALNATTNPAYCSKLLQSEPEYILGVIDDVIRVADDDDVAADMVQQRCAQRVMQHFLGVYEDSDKANGYVTIQDDPRRDDNPDDIIEAALRHSKTGPNYMAKIPVTTAGLESIKELVKRGIAICATEVFSISQAICVCELYEKLTCKTGPSAPFYVTHITGIFDQFLGQVVEKEHIDISPELLFQAGCAIAKKEYHLIKDRGYKVTLLGGGARRTQHFTEMVGGDMHVTVNWSTVQELLDMDIPIENRMDSEVAQELIEELSDKLVDFRRAYDDDGLSVDEFADFGPVLLFRSMFMDGYTRLLKEIANRRALK